MIHLTDKITDQIDKSKYALGIFVDFTKTFDTAVHHIILKKLKYSAVSGIPNK